MGLLGQDPAKPDLVIAANGGSDLIYLPNKDRKLSDRVVKGAAGTGLCKLVSLSMMLWDAFPAPCRWSRVNMRGKAVTPMPAIAVNFRSYATGCDEPTTCAVEVGDTVLRQGQGMHGSLQPRRYHELHGGGRA